MHDFEAQFMRIVRTGEVFEPLLSRLPSEPGEGWGELSPMRGLADPGWGDDSSAHKYTFQSWS